MAHRLPTKTEAELHPLTTVSTHEAGRHLRRLREQLRLKYRDVEEASKKIAGKHGNREFVIGLSRLADIENKGTLPSVFRLYSLCTIYGIGLSEVLGLYGVKQNEMAGDAACLLLPHTRQADLGQNILLEAAPPADIDPAIDLRRTAYPSRQLANWGKLPALFTNSKDASRQRYAFVGTEDWSMHPLIRPGSFLQIDETRRRIETEGWTQEADRPIYFVEHRDGFRLGWCSERDGFLIVQSHAQSADPPAIFKLPGGAEVLGQVVGVAMRLDLVKKRHTRS